MALLRDTALSLLRRADQPLAAVALVVSPPHAHA